MVRGKAVKSAAIVMAVGGLVAACGGAAAPAAPGPARPSGQSSLMDKTFAGQNKCNPKSHERPFIIEWDATDMSSFEARASKDVVFVRYEGCDLKVVEGCRPDVNGLLGSYRPVDWTAGSLESIDIANQGDLYAKLPLGAATLGGRVEAGEQFKMEYYVGGTVSATREEVMRGELAKIPACKNVTHFVYGYNLGAFALGSKSEIKGEVGGSAWGFGAGGSAKRSAKADKKGGDLALCKSDAAREIQGCKAPIRVTLREISEGDDPAVAAAKAPEAPAALSLAGKLKASSDREKEASARYDSAMQKMYAKDGKGCLADLDVHDRLDPRPAGLSTNPKAFASGLRAQCIMLSGQCDAGKALLRKQQETFNHAPDVIDRMVETVASEKCQGGKRSPRDELLHAWGQLASGARSVADCDAHYATVKRLRPVVKPNDEQDYTVTSITKAPADQIGGCFARANACEKAWPIWKNEEETRLTRDYPTSKQTPEVLRMRFDTYFPRCKGK